MCLDKKDGFVDIELNAWKRITRLGICWRTPMFDIGTKRAYNKWYKANQENITSNYTGDYYTTGFHVFPTYKEAIKYYGKSDSLARVKVRGVHTTGFQDGAKVWVAREIYVPRPKKKVKE